MHIHILGICGTFMGGLAALAREAGHRVTGCDAGVYPPMSDQLRRLGIELMEGYDADQTRLGADVYVVGNVVSRSRSSEGLAKFPLMEAILDQGLPYTSGPAWLAEHILQGRHVLAVAGTHGKTTTSSMLAWILEFNGLNPGFLIGGAPLNFAVSARLGGKPGFNTGERPLFVIEADEYDTAFFDKRSKFVHYRPRTLVLNNLEFDHADIFDSLADIERQFHHVMRTVPSSGRVVVNGDEDSLQRVMRMGCYSAQSRFGSADADYQAQGPAHEFTVLHQGVPTGQVRWALSGLHNQLNALAAIAAAADVGVSVQEACAALSAFQNVKRRMEVRGTVGGITVYDDFAHHPTAMRTTLEGLQQRLAAGERILAVFEPRSNTMKLGAMKSQLPWSLEPAALAFCYSAGLDWNAEEALAPMAERADCSAHMPELVARIAHAARPGDHIVCMSNGGFGGIHEALLQALSRRV